MYKLLEWQLNRLARNLSKLDLEINVSILRKGYSHNAAQVFFFHSKGPVVHYYSPTKKNPPKTLNNKIGDSGEKISTSKILSLL